MTAGNVPSGGTRGDLVHEVQQPTELGCWIGPSAQVTSVTGNLGAYCVVCGVPVPNHWAGCPETLTGEHRGQSEALDVLLADVDDLWNTEDQT